MTELTKTQARRFIGRIEAAADHKAGILRVKNIWFESDVRLTGKLRNALDRTLVRFSGFNGCTAAEVPAHICELFRREQD